MVPINEKLLPNNLIAEKQVLSAMLLNQDTMLQMIGEIKPEYFYLNIHRQIFEAIKKHKTTDFSVLANSIQDENGVLFDILELCAFRDCSKSAEVLRDCHSRRELITDAYRAIAAATNDFESSAEQIINRHQATIYKKTTGMGNFQPKKIGEILPAVFDQIEIQEKNAGNLSKIKTGIPSVDGKLFISPGDLIVIGARPSMGKSAFVSQILRYNAKNGNTCLFFSVEMSQEMEAKRELFSESEVSLHSFNVGTLPKRDFPKLAMGAGKLADLNLYIDSEPGITPNKVIAKINHVISQQGTLDLIVLDFLTLCKGDHSYNSKREEITEIVKAFKSIAKQFQIPFILLSQLSREVEKRTDKRPLNGDLMESGDIEAIADSIIFLYREHYYNKNEETKNMCDILCGKQRNGLSPWIQPVHVDLSIGRFSDLDTTWND